MNSTTRRQHRKRTPEPTKRTQKLTHTIASLLSRSNPNAGPVSLAPIHGLTLEQQDAKYGPTPPAPSRRPAQ